MPSPDGPPAWPPPPSWACALGDRMRAAQELEEERERRRQDEAEELRRENSGGKSCALQNCGNHLLSMGFGNRQQLRRCRRADLGPNPPRA